MCEREASRARAHLAQWKPSRKARHATGAL
jgi:hypothetical protein